MKLFKTYSEIAKELGILESTVKNILSADERKILDYLEGEESKKPKEHIAGEIAKLAYRSLKENRELV